MIFASQARNCRADMKSVPLSPFLNPLNPSHVRGTFNGAGALHVFYHRVSVRQISKAYNGSKFSDLLKQKSRNL